MTDLAEELLSSDPPPAQKEIDHAFWQACHGGQRRTAEFLLARGADINADRNLFRLWWRRPSRSTCSTTRRPAGCSWRPRRLPPTSPPSPPRSGPPTPGTLISSPACSRPASPTGSGRRAPTPALRARLFTAGLYGLMTQWHLAPGAFNLEAAMETLAEPLGFGDYDAGRHAEGAGT